MLKKKNLIDQKVVLCILLILIAFFISSCGAPPIGPESIPGSADCKGENPEGVTKLSDYYNSGTCTCDEDHVVSFCYTHTKLNKDGVEVTIEDGADCRPKTCCEKFPGADSCTGAEVCSAEWKAPPDGDTRCCSEECLLPCGYGTANGEELAPCADYSDLNEDIEEIESSGDCELEKQKEFTALYPKGVATCILGTCPDFKYAVEGPSTPSKWCEKCAPSTGTNCCIYCPPKTVYKEGVGCVSCDCTCTCSKATGLPYNDPGTTEGESLQGFLDTGFSLCKKDCKDIPVGDGVVWKGYLASKGDKWCLDIQGGTDFETYTSCCAYCPPNTYYDASSKSCKSESQLSDTFDTTLKCPNLLLTWGEDNEIKSYVITIFHAENEDGKNTGKCDKDIITIMVTERHKEIDLGLLNCTKYMTNNVKIEALPQYFDERKVKESYVSDWIDVSECNIVEPEPEDCTDGIDNDNDHDIDCEDLDCVDKICSDEKGVCKDGECKEIPSECENGIREGIEECDSSDNSRCESGECRDDCTCVPSECDDSETGPNGDWDNDTACNNDDSDKDNDGVTNLGDDNDFTQLGCDVNDNGIAIDIDGDDFCKGIDCDDNKGSIKITKDDSLCTEKELCFNKEKDTKTNEVDVDLGGDCRPYIEFVTPKYGVSNESSFDISLSTDHTATCRFSLDVPLKYKYMDEFTSSNSKMHIKEDFTLNNEIKHDFYVRCNDSTWDPEDYISKFKLYVDSSNPVITSYYAKPNPIIEKPVETVLFVETDEETLCKWDLEEQEYDSMNNKFPGFDEFDFSEEHEQRINLSDDAEDYSYYVVCKNKADLISDIQEIFVSVDLNASLIVTSTTKKYTNESSISLSVETNKVAQCFYNNVSSNMTNSFSSDTYEHKRLISHLADGNYHYYVKCHSEGKSSPTTTVIFTVDTSLVATPVVNDSSDISGYPEYSYSTEEIRVKWQLPEKKSYSNYYTYYYMLEDESGNVTINWTESTKEDKWITIDEDHNGDDLNLTNGTVYSFSVFAKNKAGSSGEVGKSDGVKIDPSKKPEECDDVVKNGNETDIDCGGNECSPCDLTNSCLENSDCYSGFCNSANECAEPDDTSGSNGEVNTCSNNEKDLGETDIDCGGVDCPKCNNERDCEVNSDCKSDKCEGSECIAVEKDSDNDGIPDKDDNCKYTSNSGQENNDGDEEGDACDTDNDNDGMPNDWEEEYGLDPFLDDADDDADDDGLTNLDEHEYKTDPTNLDSDNDGVSDGKEVEKGFDPADSDSHPASVFPIILLIIGIILLVSGIGYLLYKNFTKPKQKKPFKPTTSSSVVRPKPLINPLTQGGIKSIELRRRQAIQKIMKDRERFKAHDKVFGNFATQPKTNIKKKIHGRLDIGKPKITKTPKKTKTKTTKKKEKKPKDVFEKLSIVATAELKKYNKKTKKK